MSLPRYAVTYCAMDEEAGANPFWHACLLLSRYDEQTKKWEVVDHLGYYPQRATEENSISNKIKHGLRMNIQLSGNHGMLREEKIHEIDVGYGMNGKTYELTKKKFEELQEKCKKLKNDQAAAIEEHAKTLNLEPEEKFYEYKYEKQAHKIYELELAKAAREGVKPRLDKFTFGVYTCKSKMTDVLKGILSPDQIRQIVGWNGAIPRLSCKMEKIALHSRGPDHEYKKTSGKIVHSRVHGEKDVKLYWSFPPTLTESFSPTPSFFNVGQGVIADIKTTIKKLQKLEKLFRDATLDNEHHSARNNLISAIKKHYSVFARLESGKMTTRDEHAKRITAYLQNAQRLIDKLSMAITNNFQFELQSGSYVDVTFLAAYLTLGDKDEFFNIIEQKHSLFERRTEARLGNAR